MSHVSRIRTLWAESSSSSSLWLAAARRAQSLLDYLLLLNFHLFLLDTGIFRTLGIAYSSCHWSVCIRTIRCRRRVRLCTDSFRSLQALVLLSLWSAAGSPLRNLGFCTIPMARTYIHRQSTILGNNSMRTDSRPRFHYLDFCSDRSPRGLRKVLPL